MDGPRWLTPPRGCALESPVEVTYSHCATVKYRGADLSGFGHTDQEAHADLARKYFSSDPPASPPPAPVYVVSDGKVYTPASLGAKFVAAHPGYCDGLADSDGDMIYLVPATLPVPTEEDFVATAGKILWASNSLDGREPFCEGNVRTLYRRIFPAMAAQAAKGEQAKPGLSRDDRKRLIRLAKARMDLRHCGNEREVCDTCRFDWDIIERAEAELAGDGKGQA